MAPCGVVTLVVPLVTRALPSHTVVVIDSPPIRPIAAALVLGPPPMP